MRNTKSVVYFLTLSVGALLSAPTCCSIRRFLTEENRIDHSWSKDHQWDEYLENQKKTQILIAEKKGYLHYEAENVLSVH